MTAPSLGQRVGGDGGTSHDVYCPTDEVMIGIFGKAGDRIDRLGVICAPMVGVPDMSFQSYTRYSNSYSPSYGGNGGNTFSVVCPEHKVVTGIMGYAHDRIDQLQLICEDITAHFYTADTMNRFVHEDSTRYLSATTGTRGNSSVPAFEIMCPKTSIHEIYTLITGLQIRSGGRVDSIQLRCSTPQPVLRPH